MSKSQYRSRLQGSRVSVRQREIADGSRKVAIYDLIISVGKGRAHAEELRRRVESACRGILAEENAK